MTNVLDQLVLLDLDRTLINTNLVMDIFDVTCRQLHLDEQAVREAEAESRAKGQSFHALDYLKRRISTEQIEDFKQVYLNNAAKESLLYKDARQLLERLLEANQPFVILTYGQQEWQRLKLQAAGLIQVPAVITPLPDKGQLIASWYNSEDKFYQVSELQIRKLLLVDDKTVSFQGLPANCSGYLIVREGAHSQAPVSTNVATISSLDEVKW